MFDVWMSNWYCTFATWLGVELNHFLAQISVKMNNQNVSATVPPECCCLFILLFVRNKIRLWVREREEYVSTFGMWVRSDMCCVLSSKFVVTIVPYRNPDADISETKRATVSSKALGLKSLSLRFPGMTNLHPQKRCKICESEIDPNLCKGSHNHIQLYTTYKMEIQSCLIKWNTLRGGWFNYVWDK